jgi:Cell Wall Hydrolase/Putative peptidoglycan binding domain
MSNEIDGTQFKDKLFRSSAGQDDALTKALSYGTNPWVAVGDTGTADERGSFSTDRPNTIILGRSLAEKLAVGGEAAAYRECLIVLARGLLHWLSGSTWDARASAPGSAFERSLDPSVDFNKAGEDKHDTAAIPPSPPLPRPPIQADNVRAGVAHQLGASILDLAKRHLGQKYRFTPTPNYEDPNWDGPFDCAEYVSYCAFRAYGIPYGVVPDPVNKYNSYTGYWERDVKDRGIQISWRDALHIPGAILLRFPPGREPPPYGHIAISLGDGDSTYEARGREYGVVKYSAGGRSWNTGVLIPGVLYDTPDGLGSESLIFKVLRPPAGYSPIVELIEQKLVELGFLAEAQVNGVYDVVTAQAVSAFQEKKGLVVDGEVGPETGEALGVGDIWKKAPIPDKPALAAPPVEAETNVTAEILTLARTLYGEARGEPREGIQAVANVILNRVKSDRYPNTVAKACLQRLQFSCWNKDDPNFRVIANLLPGANPKFDAILKIAESAVLGGLPSLIGDALHYHAKSIRPSWVTKSPGATLVATIGSHLFWRGIR